ncbi:MAG: hypothetical protein Q9226_008472 [Calogaya cf. arnoldii]
MSVGQGPSNVAAPHLARALPSSTNLKAVSDKLPAERNRWAEALTPEWTGPVPVNPPVRNTAVPASLRPGHANVDAPTNGHDADVDLGPSSLPGMYQRLSIQPERRDAAHPKTQDYRNGAPSGAVGPRVTGMYQRLSIQPERQDAAHPSTEAYSPWNAAPSPLAGPNDTGMYQRMNIQPRAQDSAYPIIGRRASRPSYATPPAPVCQPITILPRPKPWSNISPPLPMHTGKNFPTTAVLSGQRVTFNGPYWDEGRGLPLSGDRKYLDGNDRRLRRNARIAAREAMARYNAPEWLVQESDSEEDSNW